MIAGFILPCGTWLPNWADPAPLAYPATIKTIGGNWICLDIYYQVASWNAATVSASTAISDATIIALVTAAKTAGMKVAIKPHLVTGDGTNQEFIVPGGIWSQNVASGNGFTASYRAGQTHVDCHDWSLTATNIGDRIATPTPYHLTEIPNSAYADQYGRGAAPTWTTIADVQPFGGGTSVAGTGNTGQRAILSTPAAGSTDAGAVLVLHDTATAGFFTQWQTILTHLLTLTDSIGGGVDGIDICTELDFLMRYYSASWRSLITTIRAGRPDLLVWVNPGEVASYLGDVPFTDALDFFGVSMYPTVGTQAGNDSYATMLAAWETALAPIVAAATAWGKQVLFGEVGARSILGAGYEPYSSQAATAQDPSQDQATFTQAFLAATGGQTWFAGFFWWVWYSPPQGAASESGAYSPKPLTQSAFSDALISGRRLTSRAGRRFRP